MEAGCQYRSRAVSSPTFECYYVPYSHPKTSNGGNTSPPFSIPRLRFTPPRSSEITYRCEPTSPDPAHWQRHPLQSSPPALPAPPSSPSSSRVRENAFKPTHKQSIDVWVEEQIHLADRSNTTYERRGQPKSTLAPVPTGKDALRQRMWDELVYEYEAEAYKWMNHEAEIRRRATQAREREREEARRRIVQEDIQRIQARVRQRRDSERQAIAEERRRSVEKAREKARRDQVLAERTVLDAWEAYESRWAAIVTTVSVLGFRDIPWPLLVAPERVVELTPDRIADFLLHPAHSPNHSRRERIRTALLRWHPDRFRRILNRVVDSERSEVEEGVGVIARCLNELLAKEGKALQHTSLETRYDQMTSWLRGLSFSGGAGKPCR